MTRGSTTPGVFTVSLDFELHWGMRDKLDPAELESRMRATREVIPRLLRTFVDYGVHCTWATVGLLFCTGRREALDLAPPAPGYHDDRLSPHGEIAELGDDEAADPTRLAPSLIARIAQTPGQEIGTHTFGHFYCLESGSTLEGFEADLAAATAAAKRRGVPLRSIVFPRNQYTSAHVEAARRAGVDVYRGNPPGRIYQPRSDAAQSPPVRAARLLDAYFPLTGLNTIPLSDLDTAPPFNIPATRFLRPYSPRFAPLEGARQLRIATEIRTAGKDGHLAHLWWHPHNFATHTEQNFATLLRVLDVFAESRARYGMRSLNMGELAAERATASCV